MVNPPASVALQDPRVLDAMMPQLCSYYGNPHSRSHAYGWESEEAVEHARNVGDPEKVSRDSNRFFTSLDKIKA